MMLSGSLVGDVVSEVCSTTLDVVNDGAVDDGEGSKAQSLVPQNCFMSDE